MHQNKVMGGSNRFAVFEEESSSKDKDEVVGSHINDYAKVNDVHTTRENYRVEIQ